MNVAKSALNFLFVSSVAVTTVGLFGLAGYAQRSGNIYFSPLLNEATCTSFNSTGRIALSETDQNISVGRQLYVSDFRLRARRSTTSVLTCKIDPSRFDTLVLMLGIDDADVELSPVMAINIFQSGSLAHSYNNVVPGDIIDVTLDAREPELAHPEDISIELICHRSDGRSSAGSVCSVYFIEAQLTSTNEYRPELRKSIDGSLVGSSRENTTTPSLIETIEDFTDMGRAVQDLIDLF